MKFGKLIGKDLTSLEGLLDSVLTSHNIEQLRWSAQPGGAFGYCVENKGNVIAGLTGKERGRWLHISLLWVSPAYRGQGLGERLVRSVQDLADKEGYEGVEVSTFSFQSPKFYEKMGFMEDGRVVDRPTRHHKIFYVWLPPSLPFGASVANTLANDGSDNPFLKALRIWPVNRREEND